LRILQLVRISSAKQSLPETEIVSSLCFSQRPLTIIVGDY